MAQGKIRNADINAAAGIDASKLSAGSVSNTEFDYLNGILSQAVGVSDTNTLSNKTLTAPVLNGTLSGSGFLTEDNFASNSATAVASQRSIKNYVDTKVQGLDAKESVVVATTANGALATAYANSQTVDGVTLTTGDRILVKNQTAAAENGIYTVNASGAPTRSIDMDAGSEFPSSYVFVEQGTANQDTGWVCTNDVVTVDTTAVTFVQFSRAGVPAAGNGLSLAGNTFSIDTAITADLSTAQSLSNKTLVTPTIASLVNANHDHSNAANGGNLDASVITTGALASARGGLGADASAYTGVQVWSAGTSSTVAAPTGTIVGDSDTQSLSNKTMVSAVLSTGVSGSAVSTDGTFASSSTTTLPSTSAVKTYVDSVAQGLSVKESVRVATTANIDLSLAMENGDAIDGVTLATGDRVLVKGQTVQADNGIYVVQATGAGIRATDMDAPAEVVGAFVFVEEGSSNADTGWVVTSNNPVTVGTSNIVWAQFSGAGTYLAGNGVTLTGSTFSINTAVTADLTTAQTLSSKTMTSPVLNGSLTGSAVLDEDAMTSNSATAVATQQSIKAYVDAQTTGTWAQEAPTGTVNGVNTGFTLASAPKSNGALQVTLDGLVQTQGAGKDYTVSGTTVTFAGAPATNTEIWAVYPA